MIAGFTELVEALVQNTPVGARVLELGTGSGRVTIPLLRSGLDLVGLDLALGKLRRLTEVVAGAPVVQANATRLPFPASSFDVVMMIRVLHLIARPSEIVREVGRVLRPGGVYLCDHEQATPDSIYVRVREAWQTILVENGWPQEHQSRADHRVAEALEAMGASCTAVEVAPIWHQTTPARELQRIADRLRVGAWQLPANRHAGLLSQLQSWMAAELGLPDSEWQYQQELALHVWRFRHG